MLKSLRIQDYALIDDLTVDFAPGLNVLTGETGTGKSIIIGALSLLLGERTDSDMIRTDRESAVIEGVFTVNPKSEIQNPKCPVQRLLSDLALEAAADDQLVIRRKVTRQGKSTCLVNDNTVSAASLKRIGDFLVDLHGQHEHQSLLNRDLHLEVLDDFAGLSAKGEALAALYREYRTIERELGAEQEELKTRRARRDATEFQLQELRDARLDPDEIARLNGERELVESAEKRLTLIRELLEVMTEGEGAVQERLSGAGRRLETLAQLDPQLAASKVDLKQAMSLLDELGRTLVKYRDTVEATPGRLDEINERLFRLERLVRKYCPQSVALDPAAIAHLIAERDRLDEELAGLEVGEFHILGLEEDLGEVRGKLLYAARELSRLRKKAKTRLETMLVRDLAGLGLTKAQLAVQVELRPDEAGLLVEGTGRYRLDETGIDDVEFLFSANPGEALKPLRKIASGGELSRIMLALKSVLAASDQVPTMVFDEIDTGIGGRIAEAVGRKLARIAGQVTAMKDQRSKTKDQNPKSKIQNPESKQVICITHLPQIARFAETHFLVTKNVQAGRTTTRLVRLSPDERVGEIARMLAGAQVTNAARVHAQELLSNGRR